MATLVRERSEQQSDADAVLLSSVPSPFPVDQLQRPPTPNRSADDVDQEFEPNEDVHHMRPSIVRVEWTCVMALNDLLSTSHSLLSPSFSPDTHSGQQAISAIVSNLRQNLNMPPPASEDEGMHLGAVIDELGLSQADKELVKTLDQLMNDLAKLSVIQQIPPSRLEYFAPSEDAFESLRREIRVFQEKRVASEKPMHRTSTELDTEPDWVKLMWYHIDMNLDTVATMCKERAENPPRFSAESPPQYDAGDFKKDYLPEYESGSRQSFDDSKSETPSAAATIISDEKMRMDLEAVTAAIDHLYLVAPQLNNQRVELKDSKVRQMQKATIQGKGKEKERNGRELDRMFNLIDKASSRTLVDQSVILENGMGDRLKRAQERDTAKREAFVDHLAEHSSSRRLHGQDAMFVPPRPKDPDAMLSLPEFMRERMPAMDEALRSISPPLPPVSPSGSSKSAKESKRPRSASATALAWLGSHSRSLSGSGSSTPVPVTDGKTGVSSPGPFEVQHVAEFHENLQHVLVFLVLSGGSSNAADLEAEVVRVDDGQDRLLIRSGGMTSAPLLLPARVQPGRKDIQNLGGHFEIKMAAVPDPEDLSAISTTDPIPLLDASQLAKAAPTSLLCASCSLPIVQSSKVQKYEDLPSEHWEELVDAWMCHSDQKLHEQVMKRGREGFWPSAGQALVGSSYILFDETAVVKTNTNRRDPNTSQEKWRLIRCLCGATIGRCQQRQTGDNTVAETEVYRVLKYAVNFMLPRGADFQKIPLSAYVIEDMNEYARAHATYRFVVHDEEDERPRILLWLFKPSLHLAYSKTAGFVLPRSGRTHGAKVLYQLLSPTEAAGDLKTITSKYPGFPQAEYLYYPMNACRILAATLKESNKAYPERLRSMTGLEVGWLGRH